MKQPLQSKLHIFLVLAIAILSATTIFAAPGDLDLTFNNTGKSVIQSGDDTDYLPAIVLQTDGKIVATVDTPTGSFNVVRYNTDGSLDTTFGTNGSTEPRRGVAYSAAIQADGKILLGGGDGYAGVIYRYNSNGTVDTSFGSSGRGLNPYVGLYSIGVQPDGKIVGAGITFTTMFGTASNGDFGVVRHNADGSLDTTFGLNGIVTTSISANKDFGRSVSIQADGKIVVAGNSKDDTSFPDIAIVRYNPNGSLDATFDTDGIITTNLGGGIAYSVAIQSDGKIVAAGDGPGNPVVIRYYPNGSLDTTFDGDGIVSLPLPSGLLRSVLIQPDSKIVASGWTSGLNSNFVVVRYNPDGSLDSTFNSNGIVTAIFGTSFNSSLCSGIQTDGKLVIAGNYGLSLSGFGDTTDVAILRLNPNGSFDTTFNTDGKVVTGQITSTGLITAIASQADGKIVATGYSIVGTWYKFTTVRYLPDGNLDPTFGLDGKVVTNFNPTATLPNIRSDAAFSIAVQSDGKIITAGFSAVAGPTDGPTNFALVRYNTDGSLDASFDGDGKVTTNFLGSNFSQVNSVLIQSDGKIVAAGYSYVGSFWDFAIARYNSDGSLDTTFDSDGLLTTPLSSRNDVINSLAIQSDGKFVAAGVSEQAGVNMFTVVRYNSNGSLDITFDTDGKVFTQVGNTASAATAIAIQTDGKIVGSGDAFNGTNQDFAVVRYNLNGSLDTSFDGDGIAVTTNTAQVENTKSLAIQSDGKIVVGGTSGTRNSSLISAIPNFALNRYNPDGSLDNTFGISGKVITDFHFASIDEGAAIAIQPDGKIIFGGHSDYHFAVARYQTFPPLLPGTVNFSSAAFSQSEGATAIITVNRVEGSVGAISVDYSTSNGTATAGICGTADYVATSGTLNWADADSNPKTFTIQLCTDNVLDPAETINIALSNPTGGAMIGATNPAILTIVDIPPPFQGSYTVGSGGNFPSLTNAGGIFEAINLVGATGSINIHIVSDLTGETGAVALNPVAGNFPVSIKPNGGPKTISGVAPIAVIRINGADNITIDGYDPPLTVVGGNPSIRQLTIQNLSTSTSSGVIALHSNTDGANNNIIRNVNVLGNDPTQTFVGISSGGAAIGSPATVANNNNRIENCSVQKTVFGISSLGVSTVVSNIGTVITQNDITGTGNNRVARIGIQIQNENGVQVTENSIGGLDSSLSVDAIGIAAGTISVSATNTTVGNVTNAFINRNRINGITQSNTFSSVGIAVSGGTNNLVSNNMITGVIGDGNSGDLTAGIYIVGAAGSTTKLYYNSVSMTGDRSSVLTSSTTMFPSYGLAITGTNPIIELKNNIFATTQTASSGGANATSYAIGMASTTFSNLDSNYNAFYSTGANSGGFRTGSLAGASTVTTEVDYSTLGLWRTAVSDDANSVQGNPAFNNPNNDLHIIATNVLLVDKGTVVSALDDFDGQIRSLTGFVGGTPDIGADEAMAPTAATATINGRVTTAHLGSIRNVMLTLADTTTGEIKYAKTNPFGYYRFIDLEVGRSYVLSVSSKRFTFANQSRLINLDEDLTDEDFVADEK
jgi:uncharacterized delta-60 repeat protein